MAEADSNGGGLLGRLNPMKAWQKFAYGDPDGETSPPVTAGGAPARPAYRGPVVAVAAMTSPGVSFSRPADGGAGSSGNDQAAIAQVGAALEKGAPEEYLLVARLLNGLRPVLPDEAALYKGVLVSLKAQEKPAETVLAGFDSYLRSIDDYAAGFQQSLVKERETALGGAERDLRTLSDEIQEKHAEIGAIQAELSELEARRNQIDAEMRATRAHLESTEASVSAAVSAIRDRVAQERQQFQQYAKE